MTHTNKPAMFLRSLTTSVLMAGIAVMSSAPLHVMVNSDAVHAAVQRGSTVLDRLPEREVIRIASALHPVASDLIVPGDTARWQMILGMLLILTGFLCHLLYVLRHERLPRKEGGRRIVLLRGWFRENLDRSW